MLDFRSAESSTVTATALTPSTRQRYNRALFTVVVLPLFLNFAIKSWALKDIGLMAPVRAWF